MTEQDFSATFDFNVIRDSKRIIEGVASLPTVDREKEVILKSAIEGAIRGYMELPILHLQHTERAIGMVTKAEITSDGLHITAVIRERNGSDDVWQKIKSGEYGKFSIFGRRINASPECRLSPASRSDVAPCITKALYLDSISVVNSLTAVNQETWLNVVKALSEESVDNYISTETTEPVTTIGINMVEKVVAPEAEEESIEETPVPETPEIQKADPTLLEALKEIKDLLISKAEDEKPVKKAKVEDPDLEEIVKARVESAVEEIKKAFDEKFSDLLSRIEKMEAEEIKKGSAVVVIQGEMPMTTPKGTKSALEEFEGAKK